MITGLRYGRIVGDDLVKAGQGKRWVAGGESGNCTLRKGEEGAKALGQHGTGRWSAQLESNKESIYKNKTDCTTMCTLQSDKKFRQ